MTTTYNVYQDAVLVGNVSDLPTTISGLTNGQQYSFSVKPVVNGVEGPAVAPGAVLATPFAAGSRPWPLPVTTGTYTVSVDNTGATDVTSALNAYIATVPNGSIISFPLGTYKISAAIDLRGKNNLIFEGNGSTLNNVANANSGSSEPKSFFYTQAPGHAGAVSSHITIRNFVATGANPTPGVLPAGEFAAFLTAYGGSYFEVANVTASGLFGDLATFNQFATYAYVHDNHVINCGRNGISIVNLSHLVAEDNAFDTVGYTTFDIEPENASLGSTLTNLIFRNNTAGTWVNSFMSGGGAQGTAIDGVTISGNTVTGSSLQTIIPGILTRAGGTVRRNFTIINNTSLVSAAGPVMVLKIIDGLTVTGNTQPLSSGSLVSVTDCTSAVTSPNP